MKVVVIGAGAVGLCCAYYLAADGVEVTVLDAREPGGGASRRNAGWVVPSMAGPVPAPGVVTKAARWMLRRDSPLYIRPTLRPEFLSFMVAMLRNCTEDRFERGLRSTVALGRRTFELFDRLEGEGVAFEHHRRGLLLLFQTRKSLDEHAAELDLVDSLSGGSSKVLDATEARRAVPDLSRDVVGAIECPDDRCLDPDSFIDALTLACQRRGVQIIEGEAVTAVETSPTGRVTAVRGKTSWRADTFVLATGAWSGRLAQLFGQRLPIQAGKGYGFDLDPGLSAVGRTLYLSEAKVAVTPLATRTRLAGTMAFGDLDETVDRTRANGILTSAQRYFRNWPSGPGAAPWCGLRPMTPDGLPVIGRLQRHNNVVVATGHAMLGITLSPVTGDIVRQLVIDDRTPDEAKPFSPARFG